MRKTQIVLCTLLFIAVAGFAQTPSPPPLTSDALAAILGEPTVTGSCGAQASGVLFAARRPAGLEKALCSATANCGAGITVSCQGNQSTTSCTGVDRNCS